MDISASAFDKINRKTKPPGSLGVLETMAVRLAVLKQTLEPTLTKKRICVYAGSHGVASEGVSAYPSEVTGQMVLNFVSGGAAINVLARHGGIGIHIIDAGVDTDWPESFLSTPDFYFRSVRRGTSNFYREPAMNESEYQQALEIGCEQVRNALDEGIDLLGIGEMGIGNTTAASALLVALCDLKPAEAVGRGTGIDDGSLQRKMEVVAGAYERYSPACCEPAGLYWLRVVGGFEIAAMAGSLLEAARNRLPVVVDGFIATAAFSIDQNCSTLKKQSGTLRPPKKQSETLRLLNFAPFL